MSGTGPYVNDDGDVWVPRTVSYLRARQVAAEANQNDDRLIYVGKTQALLLGFTRGCFCEEVCSEANREDEDGNSIGDPNACRVPAWHFRTEERP